MKYQLPCETCGKSAEVESSQAGQRIQCECGAGMEVPSLRGIRELEPATASDTAGKSRSWTPGRGVAFAAGLVLVISGLVPTGIGALSRRQLDLSRPLPDDVAVIAEDTNKLSIEQTFDLFQEARNGGLGPYVAPQYVMMRQYDKTMWIVMLVGIGMVIAGILSIGGAMLFRGNQRQ